jgi:hypothetical protein
MKKLNLIRIFAISCLTIGVMSNQDFAQCYNFIAYATANIDAISTSGTSFGHTGNDSRNSATLGHMEVSVWDDAGGQGALAWNDGTHTSHYTFTNGETLPDVALVESNGKWYAVVVYGIYSAGGYNAWIDLYYWGSNTFIPVGGGYPQLLPDPGAGINAKFTNVIRIDADASGNFAIVWDDTKTYKGIQAIAGHGNSGSAPSLCGSPTSYQLVAGTSSRQYQKPDVSLNYDCSTPNTSYIYYVYVDFYSSPENLNIGQADYTWLCSASGSNNTTYKSYTAASSSYTYDNPRIACPPCGNSAWCYDSWAVVSEYHGSSTNDIIGYSSVCGTSYGPYFYTDLATGLHVGPCTINADDNKDPAISYDSDNDGIMIGWDTWCSTCFLAIGHSTVPPSQSIALPLNIDGTLNSATLAHCSASNYFIVSNDNTDQSQRLSISGRDYYNILPVKFYMQYTFWHTTSYVAYKDVPYNSCNLREGKPNSHNADNIVISPNPFTEDLYISLASETAGIKVFDITGNLLLTSAGNQDEINQSLNELAAQLPKGIYMLRLDAKDGSNTVNKKFIKM